jgi:hypothetical protein
MPTLFTTLLLSAGEAIGGLIAFLIIGFIYFLPTYIGRNKRNAAAIFWLNLLTGWTGLGWIVVFIWALTQDPVTVVVQPPAKQSVAPAPLTTQQIVGPAKQYQSQSTSHSQLEAAPQAVPHPMTSTEPAPFVSSTTLTGELERLFSLKEKGALTEEEYMVHKAKLLA